MKKFLLALLGLGFVYYPAFAQINRCSTMEYHLMRSMEDPTYQGRIKAMEEIVLNAINNREVEAGDPVIVIPVVVHVVYRVPVQNISDQQIFSQIDVLNEDFRKLNADTANTRSIFKGLAADARIEFCLAQRDPMGNATSGITRTATTVNGFTGNNDVKFDSTGGKTGWPSDNYLNIWVCNLGGSNLGYSSFPGENPKLDGLVIGYRFFGTIGTAQSPFNLGRTATHETGHWLGLRHVWADTPDCTLDDNAGDTPKATGPNYGCPVDTPNTCFDPPSNPPDMFENFMDYTDDICMNMFTHGQKTLMTTTLNTVRSSILSSSSCFAVGVEEEYHSSLAITLSPNPVSDLLEIKLRGSIPEPYWIEVYSTSGVLVEKKLTFIGKDNDFGLPVSHLKTGIYLLRIQGKEKSFGKLFIKQ